MLNKSIAWVRARWEIPVSLLLAIWKPISFSTGSSININGKLIELFTINSSGHEIVRTLLSWLIFWAILRGLRCLLGNL